MKLAIYRKSVYTKDETITKLKEVAENENLKLLSEVKLSDTTSLFQVCDQKWINDLIESDKNLLGLLPCNILVIERDGSVSVGVGNPAILRGVSQNHAVQHLSLTAEDKLKSLIKNITGSEDPKPTKVKLYSTTTCPYCVMEKKWLDENGIEHEVIYVDKDQRAAEQMVRETGQMGVPVTEVAYGTEEKEFVVGFDKLKLIDILGINQ